MPEFILNRFIVEGVHYEYLPGRWQHITDDNYGVTAMSYKTITQDRVVVVQKPYSATNTNVGKRKVVKQAWVAAFDQESFVDVCMYDHLKHLYETQANFWIQYDDEMSRCFAIARPLYNERQVYLTPTFPIFPKGWSPTNGATFTVYVNDVEVTTGFTVDQEHGLIIFDTAHTTDVQVQVAYTWRAYVRLSGFNLQPSVLAQHVYVGELVFEQVTSDFDDERFNISYDCVTCTGDELIDPLDGPGYRGDREGGEVSTCTVYTAAGAAATINRTGWTDDFANPTNALTSDNTYATAAMGANDKTKLLQLTNMVPSPAVPTGATIDSVRVRIEHSATGTSSAIPVIQDEAYLLVSGSRVGSNVATLTRVPNTDTLQTYTYTPTLPAGVTVAALNAGDIGFEIGYRSAIVETSAGNLSIGLPPQQTDEAAPTVNVTHTHVVTVTYTGGGPTPEYVILDLQGTVTGGGKATGMEATDYEGSASVTGINGTTSAGLIEAPALDYGETVSVVETKRVLVALTAGVGMVEVEMSGSVTIANYEPGNVAYVSSHVTASSVVAPSTTTLQIDAAEISVCYTA